VALATTWISLRMMLGQWLSCVGGLIEVTEPWSIRESAHYAAASQIQGWTDSRVRCERSSPHATRPIRDSSCVARRTRNRPIQDQIPYGWSSARRDGKRPCLDNRAGDAALQGKIQWRSEGYHLDIDCRKIAHTNLILRQRQLRDANNLCVRL